MACTSVTANLARFHSPSVQDATLKKLLTGTLQTTLFESTPQNRQAPTNYHLPATTVTTENHQRSSQVQVSFRPPSDFHVGETVSNLLQFVAYLAEKGIRCFCRLNHRFQIALLSMVLVVRWRFC